MYSRAFFSRVGRLPQLNETVKQDKIREEPETRIGAVCVEYGRARLSIVFKVAPWPCRGAGGIAASNKHPWYRTMSCLLFLAPYVRTTVMKRLFAFRPKSLLITGRTSIGCQK